MFTRFTGQGPGQDDQDLTGLPRRSLDSLTTWFVILWARLAQTSLPYFVGTFVHVPVYASETSREVGTSLSRNGAVHVLSQQCDSFLEPGRCPPAAKRGGVDSE